MMPARSHEACLVALMIVAPLLAPRYWEDGTEAETSPGVWTWGSNYFGQLGDGTTTDSLTPVRALGFYGEGNLDGVTAVAAGGFYTVALRP